MTINFQKKDSQKADYAKTDSEKNELLSLLHQWVCDKNPGIDPAVIDSETPIIEQRLINSLQIMDLILYIEYLNGEPINVAQIRPGAFSTLGNILNAFFCKEGSICA